MFLSSSQKFINFFKERTPVVDKFFSLQSVKHSLHPLRKFSRDGSETNWLKEPKHGIIFTAKIYKASYDQTIGVPKLRSNNIWSRRSCEIEWFSHKGSLLSCIVTSREWLIYDVSRANQIISRSICGNNLWALGTFIQNDVRMIPTLSLRNRRGIFWFMDQIYRYDYV